MSKCSEQSLLVLPPRGLAPGARFQKRALLIGVAEYPVVPSVPALPPVPGADRNPWLLAAELAKRGFACELLLNERAKRDEIRNAIRSLVIQARAGDVCVLAFSGHGYSTPGQDTAATDGGDYLYPHDAQVAGPIRSDELLRWLVQPEGRVSLYCVIDACHSGAMARGLFSHLRFPRWLTSRRAGDETTVHADQSLHHVVLSACREDERADYSERTCGTFTRALVDVLAKSSHVSTRDVMTTVAAECARVVGPGQHPQLRGPAAGLDAEIFSSFRRPTSTLPPQFSSRRVLVGRTSPEVLPT